MIGLLQRRLSNGKENAWEDYTIPQGIESLRQLQGKLCELQQAGQYRWIEGPQYRPTYFEIKQRRVYVAVSLPPERS